MVTKKVFATIRELQDLQRAAIGCTCDVGLHAPDDQIIVDAKSYIGIYTLDFSKPILVVSEDARFHALIQDIGQTVE